MSERLPPIDDALMTPAQAEAKAAVLGGARGVFQGPFVPLLRSPGLMKRLETVGAYLRFESGLPGRIREFAILMVARAFDQQVEWAIHYPIAQREGVSAATLAAIAEGRRPDDMAADEASAYAFLTELRTHQAVSDVGYERALGCFGEAGVIDLVAIAGYYGLLAMVMNVARTPAPPGDAPPLAPIRAR
ncbi:MAG: carboxymuconolactone decarboxylase family protein [Acidocella sp.]|nr:carboxymuconolactone decarboxylase family protein [Acidocella sp.]